MVATVGTSDSGARALAASTAAKQSSNSADAAAAAAAQQATSKADAAASLRAKALQPREDPLKAYAQSLVGKASASAEKAEWTPTVVEVPAKPRGIEAPAAQPAIKPPSASDVVSSSMQAIEELSGLKGEGRERALKAVAGALIERFGQDGAKALQEQGFGRLLDKGAVVDHAA